MSIQPSFLASCLWLVSLPMACALEEPQQARPNILFVVIDTLRGDHVGCYGYKRDTTPCLDQFAEQGARFEQMIAPSSWTLPSVMSLFTSLPPSLHRATNYQRKLTEDATTLAAELKKAGYQTFGVVANPTASAKFGFSKGFDVYDDYTAALAGDLNLFQDFEREASVHTVKTSPIVNRVALNWLGAKRDRQKPFFLLVLYFDAHADYMPPPPYDRMFDPDYAGTIDGRNMYSPEKARISAPADRAHIQALYDGCIRYVDEHVGQLLKKLDDLDLAKSTCVLITSDHGEEFWDHGKILHGHTLYDELVRVPFLVRWPGHIAPGLAVKAQVGGTSIMPTLLELAGAPRPTQCTARSFYRALVGKEVLEDQPAFSETEMGGKLLKALRTPSAKLVWDATADKRVLFDLQKDPLELSAVTGGQQQEISGQLDTIWKFIELKASTTHDGGRPELGKRLIERLKAMGYVQ